MGPQQNKIDNMCGGSSVKKKKLKNEEIKQLKFMNHKL